MAYGKKRTRSGRFLKRRKSVGRRFVRRKSVRRLKRRGGVYTKRTKFPAKNPFGDRALVKLRFNYGGFLAGDNASSQTSTGFPVNDLQAVANSGQTFSKGFLTYPKLFKRYKVNGVMAKFTVFQLQANTGDPYPLVAWILPYSVLDGTPTVVSQNINSLKAERHTAWGNVKNWGWGGGPTTVKKFIKMKTVVGANYPTTDIDYSGITDLTGNPYQAPSITWLMLGGISTVAQIALPSDQSVHYNMELTYYVEFFEQTWEQQGI